VKRNTEFQSKYLGQTGLKKCPPSGGRGRKQDAGKKSEESPTEGDRPKKHGEHQGKGGGERKKGKWGGFFALKELRRVLNKKGNSKGGFWGKGFGCGDQETWGGAAVGRELESF